MCRSIRPSSRVKVEVFKASNVLSPVIDKLQLTGDKEFIGSTGGPIGDLNAAVRHFLGLQEPLSKAELRERALNTLLRNMSVKRVGLSFVIEVSYRSVEAKRAAQIDNAIVEAYLAEQARSKTYTAQRASGWLEDSLKVLRASMVEAEHAVGAFRDANKIVTTGGRPIKEQEINDLNSQLAAAIGRTSDARARLDRINVVLSEPSSSSNPIDATVSESLKSDVISKLRSQYLDLANQEADLSRRYGADHQAAVKLRDQMQQIRLSIIDELRRIAASDKSDYEINLQNQEQIQDHLSHAISRSEIENAAQVKLRELESAAKSYRDIYEDFTKRYLQSVQEQSYPIADGRLISPAAVPLRVSWPRASVVFMVSALLGLLVGFVLALVLDVRAAFAAHLSGLNRPAA